jgi:2-polyprenyl-3-methyl-5-hydroxy-6-metoxy-1,4-benzoquinol methylase
MENSKVAGSRLTDTASEGYTDRLRRLSGSRWKQVINVQAPYQWNLRRLALGKTLDIGCGIGRNWRSFGSGSVGTDHNEHSVAYCNEQGFEAHTPDDFFKKFSPESVSFDSLLIAHVFEHLTAEQDLGILHQYLPYLRSGGRVVIITPQEAGYASDASHVEFMPFEKVAQIVGKAGLKVEKHYSFPFPRRVGKVFKYNEFVFVAKKP